MSKSGDEQQQQQHIVSKTTDAVYWFEQWLGNKIGFHRLTVNKYV